MEILGEQSYCGHGYTNSTVDTSVYLGVCSDQFTDVLKSVHPMRKSLCNKVSLLSTQSVGPTDSSCPGGSKSSEVMSFQIVFPNHSVKQGDCNRRYVRILLEEISIL